MRTASSLFNGRIADSTSGRHSEHRMNNPLPAALASFTGHLLSRAASRARRGTGGQWAHSEQSTDSFLHHLSLCTADGTGGEGGQEVGGVCGNNSVHFV